MLGTCQRIEAWAAEADNVTALKDAQATIRRLEVRMGELMGPAMRGGDHGNQHSGGKSSATDLPLSPNERTEFRKMAENTDVVEAVIAASSDTSPPPSSRGSSTTCGNTARWSRS